MISDFFVGYTSFHVHIYKYMPIFHIHFFSSFFYEIIICSCLCWCKTPGIVFLWDTLFLCLYIYKIFSFFILSQHFLISWYVRKITNCFSNDISFTCTYQLSISISNIIQCWRRLKESYRVSSRNIASVHEVMNSWIEPSRFKRELSDYILREYFNEWFETLADINHLLLHW